jgi:outer membrane protein assembly factor BamD (BamD/ComL family)
VNALRTVLACLACAVLSGTAIAQTRSFVLDDSGEWVAQPEPDRSSDEKTYDAARRLLAEGRAAQARSMASSWIDRNERTENPMMVKFYLLRGDARLASGDEYKALFDYEELIAQFPNSEEFSTAVEREMGIGISYLNGLRRKFLGLRVAGASHVGEELLMRTQERLPGTETAERANMELAAYYYRVRELRLASEAYDIFLRNYPRSDKRREAMLRQIYANLARFKGPKYDAAGLTEARVLIDRFVAQYPADGERAGLGDALVTRIDESQGEQMLDTARWYLKRGDPRAARLTIERLLVNHPQTIAARRGIELSRERGWSDAEAQLEVLPNEGKAPQGPEAGDGARAPGDQPAEGDQP